MDKLHYWVKNASKIFNPMAVKNNRNFIFLKTVKDLQSKTVNWFTESFRTIYSK